MDYLQAQIKLQSSLNKTLSGNEVTSDSVLNSLFEILGGREITVEEIGVVFELINSIVLGEKHRDQLFELLEEKVDWPRETIKEVSSEIDDKVLSVLKKTSRTKTAGEAQFSPKKINARNEISTETPREERTVSINPKKEGGADLDELKEKIKRLEERKGEFTPPSEINAASDTKEYEQKKEISVQKERFGVAPAKDLGAADFDWQGNVGGVEIEQTETDSSENGEEILDKARILDEVEHPPAYSSPSPLEERLKKSEIKTPESPSIRNFVPEPQKEVSLNEPVNPGSEDVSLKDLERQRQQTYKSGDPYREPIE